MASFVLGISAGFLIGTIVTVLVAKKKKGGKD